MQQVKLTFRKTDSVLYAKIMKLREREGLSISQAIMSLLRREIKKVEAEA